MEDQEKLPRLVLAEDHGPMALQLRALLAPACEIVGTVEDGSALVAAADALEPDVIVSDISMPRLSGLAAARIILARHPSTRFVFVTVRDERAVVRAALKCGGLACVLKCDAGDELVAAVRAAIAGEEYLSTNAPDAERRAALKERVLRVSPRVAPVAIVVGGNLLMRAMARLVAYGMGLTSVGIHVTRAEAIEETGRAMGRQQPDRSHPHAPRRDWRLAAAPSPMTPSSPISISTCADPARPARAARGSDPRQPEASRGRSDAPGHRRGTRAAARRSETGDRGARSVSGDRGPRVGGPRSPP